MSLSHYVVTKAAPPSGKKTSVPEAFITCLQSLNPGDAFAFPVNHDLKNPLAPFKAAGRSASSDTAARYRWTLSDADTGMVYRTK